MLNLIIAIIAIIGWDSLVNCWCMKNTIFNQRNLFCMHVYRSHLCDDCINWAWGEVSKMSPIVKTAGVSLACCTLLAGIWQCLLAPVQFPRGPVIVPGIPLHGFSAQLKCPTANWLHDTQWCVTIQVCIYRYVGKIRLLCRAQRLINLEIPVLVRSLKSSNVELG